MERGKYGNRGQTNDWFDGAPADDAIHGTIAGLRRLGTLPQDQRQRFFEQVAQDQVALKVLEDLKTQV